MLGLLSMFGGCNGTGAGPGVGDQADYRLEGAVIQDRNTGRSIVVARLYRADTLRPAATVVFDTASLAFDDNTVRIDTMIASDSVGDTVRYITTVGPADDSSFARWFTSSTLYAGDGIVLNLQNGSGFDQDFATTLVDTFSIATDGIVPQNRIVRANDVVTVDWGGSANATAYVLAAVRADTAYQGAGYSLYPAGLTTDGTIPPDAFLVDGTSNLDTGLYRIYVYSIFGAPDSALTADLLPVPLPSQLSDNIDTRELDGRFGTIMITPLDTVRVSAQ